MNQRLPDDAANPASPARGDNAVKATHAGLWTLGILAAFALGRWGLPAPGDPAPRPQVDDRVEAIGLALSERDALERAYALSVPLLGLSAGDLPGVMRLMEERYRQLSREDVRLIALAWSRLDAASGFEWAIDQPGKWGETLAAEAIYAWGFRHGAAPLAALEALGESESDEFRLRLNASALDGWLASGEHAGASTHVAGIDDPRVRRKRAMILAAEVAKDGPEALIAWAEAVPEDAANDFKTLAFYNALGIVTRDEPQRAIGIMETHGDQPYTRGSLAVLARRWVQYHEPADLFAWLETLPAGAERDEAIGDGFRVWQRRQAEKAEQWLEGALPASYLDPAIAELVQASAQAAPQAAVVWADRIQNPKQRRRSLVRAGREFWSRSPQAAALWLEGVDLPEAAKKSVSKGRQRVRPRGRPAAGEEAATGSG